MDRDSYKGKQMLTHVPPSGNNPTDLFGKEHSFIGKVPPPMCSTPAAPAARQRRRACLSQHCPSREAGLACASRTRPLPGSTGSEAATVFA